VRIEPWLDIGWYKGWSEFALRHGAHSSGLD
jgi:hypothetical protein